MSNSQASECRKKIRELGESLSEICGYLEKDEHFPDLADFLLK